MLQEYLQGEENTNSHFLYPSGVDQFKQEFARLEDHKENEEERNSPPVQRKYTSLPRLVSYYFLRQNQTWGLADQTITRFGVVLQRTGVFIRGRRCWFGSRPTVFVLSGVYTSTDSKQGDWVIITEDNTSRQSSSSNSGKTVCLSSEEW